MPNLTVTSFEQAHVALKTAKNRANGKPVASSTRLHDREHQGILGGAVAVKYHDTDVVTYYADGSIRLDTGGWLTMSTRSRIEEYLPAGYRVASVKGRWYLMTYEHTATGSGSFAWLDGITIHADGTVTGFEPDAVVAEQDAANKALDKAVKGYVALITPEAVETAIAQQGGDCFLCMAGTSSTEHLVSHIEEGYVVCRLLANAVEAKGYQAGIYVVGAVRGGFMLDTVRGVVRDYLRAALYQGAVATRNGRKPVGAVKSVWQRGA